jgi:hypothetical protein
MKNHHCGQMVKAHGKTYIRVIPPYTLLEHYLDAFAVEIGRRSPSKFAHLVNERALTKNLSYYVRLVKQWLMSLRTAPTNSTENMRSSEYALMILLRLADTN